MRRPLVPPPNRPNPTDPGDAADLSIPQGYQCDRRCLLPPPSGPRRAKSRFPPAQGNVAHLPRKSTNYVVDNEENLVNLNERGLTAAFRSRWVLGRNARRGCLAGQDDPRKRRMVSMNLATEIGFDR